MFGILFLLFVTVPFIELYLLFKLSDRIGASQTLVLIIFTGLVGAWAARREGRRVWLESMRSYQKGALPADHMIHGVLIFVGGVLLITPGILTDVVGFAAIFPITRALYVRALKAWFRRALRSGKVHFHSNIHVDFQGFDPPAEEQRQERDVTPRESEMIDVAGKDSSNKKDS